MNKALIVRELIGAAGGSECALSRAANMGKCTGYAFLLLSASLLCILSSCSSTQTSTGITASTTQKCQFQVATSSSSFPENGGTGTLSIDTTRDCTWSVSNSANWVSLADGAGQGGASVPYTVAANTVPQTRVANLNIEGQAVQLSQAPAPCRYALSSSSESVGYPGGTLTVSVQTLTGCGWSTSSDSGWLSVTSNASGNSTAVVGFSIAANGGPQRVGHALIGGQSFTVTQQAGPMPVPSPSPTPPPTPTPTPTPPPAPTPTPSPTPTPTPTPSPTPTPTPTPVPPAPTPPPPPPPPTPSPTTVSGAARNISGDCPDIRFTVNGTTVVADKSTKFTGGKCDKLKNGDDVSVTGVVSSGTVSASEIHKQ